MRGYQSRSKQDIQILSLVRLPIPPLSHFVSSNLQPNRHGLNLLKVLGRDWMTATSLLRPATPGALSAYFVEAISYACDKSNYARFLGMDVLHRSCDVARPVNNCSAFASCVSFPTFAKKCMPQSVQGCIFPKPHLGAGALDISIRHPRLR